MAQVMANEGRPLRLGLIGTGVAARELHWPALRQLQEQITLVALCGRTMENVQAFASHVAETGGPVTLPCYTGWADFLDHPGLDAVLVALPATENLQISRIALAAGKHVLVEKPLAANGDEALQMLALAAAHPQLVTMVAENIRYSSALLRIKAWLDSGVAGRVYALHWQAANHMLADNRYIASGWRTDAAFPGGLLLDAGVHYSAGVQLLLGDIAEARLLTSKAATHLGAWDGASLQFTTRNGANGTLDLYFAAVGQAGFRLLLLAERGSAQFDGHTLLLHGADGSCIEEDHRSDDFGYAAEFLAFRQAIATGTATASPFAQAWQDMRVWTAALAQPGQVVQY
ncbi:scyllo-inositol 2-dehydrogenase (NADP(+)) [Andreprevotia sp. IGB-42]|uniref:Gfo/Idh/MocA family protein n=1 Tax=Andreprevotia sp. IGB-42 TaxID=2497473 RepID=UPI00135B0C88|nr:Gfo/Idh/MocA family oxidoreductase [Andreprevotia sp. IGB-42]KAF0814431.1 scyllo-inositol 2-dehydrogenase (NADP(+)) [Andreprevotia sp. IGB-42]